MDYGLLINPIIMLGYWFGEGLLFLINGVAGDRGADVTPETILFNELEITNINFFESGSSDSFAAKLKTNIAAWYYTMRTIAIVASLCVLLYIAIRMATSTIASDKAEYKRMLIDWVVGFALIFVLHYIILLVVTGNNVIVDVLREVMNSESGATSGELTNFIEKVGDQVKWNQEVSKTLSATFIFLILVGITFAFLAMYIKRMIVVAFLIIIAPLITITYAIDKVGDSKSQALDAWTKEFVWTILVQPFHCVIYVVFVSIAVDSLNEATLSSSVLAIMSLLFILQAEDIIKKIFGIQADNIGKMSSSYAMAAGGVLAAAKLSGKTGGKAVSATGNAAQNLSKKLATTNVQQKGGIGTGPTSSNSNSFSQKVANMVGSDAVQKRLQTFNNWMKDTKTGRAVKTAGNLAGDYVNYGYKAASTMTGVALSMPSAKGAQDLISGGIAGYAAGQGLQAGAKWVAKKGTTDVVERGRTRNATMNLQESYRQMRQNTGFTDDQMLDKARVYLKLDLASERAKSLGDVERLFAYNLQAMKGQLEKSNLDTSAENIISKISLRDTSNDAGNNGKA